MNIFTLFKIVLGWFFRLTLHLLPLFIRLPVLLGSMVMRLVGLLRALLSLPRRFRAATADTMACKSCHHATPLLGRWRAPCCGAIEVTHAWAPCRICGTRYVAGFIACDTCGVALANPLLWRPR